MFKPLRTLGGLSLESREGSAPGRSTQRKRLALLALLAAARNGGVSRDKIIAYLWPDGEEEQSRHALSQTLYALRREFGEQSIIAGVDALRLNHEVVPSDVAELNAAIAARDLDRIVTTYTGPFLDGFFLPGAAGFEEWVAQRRAEYERVYTAALDDLAAAALKSGDAPRAAGFLQARAVVDPLNSEVALRLMRALAATGDRAGALRHFRTHAVLLREEMQLEPGRDLQAFAEECARTEERPVAPARAAPAAMPVTEPVTEPVIEPPPKRGRRPAWWATASALAGLAVVLLLVRGSARRPDSHVLLADVAGPDSSLSLAVREALRAELEQSKGVRVLGDVVTYRTLELMRLPPSTPVNEVRALEVAQRRGIPFVVTASVQPVGSGVQIVARMIDVQTDRVVATSSERPNQEEDILGAVASIAEKMRQHVTRIRAARSSPMPAVTTASLPALRNYALARRALANWDRERALGLLEAALVHDSAFALAHYLAGDLLWYIDKQQHSDQHMQRALELADRLPPREQLIVKARYQQLVRDEPDSALVYWKLLVDSYPDEPLAYEGMRWVYRALGNTKEMADASERGFQRDPTQWRNAYYDRATERMEARDTVGALASFRKFEKGEGEAVARTHYYWQITSNQLPSRAVASMLSPSDVQIIDLLSHNFDDAGVIMESMRNSSLQYYPRALLAQGRMEWEFEHSAGARARLAEAVAWIENADLSPPAYARLAERAAEFAVQLQDRNALQRMRALIDRHDGGRDLRSYRLARNTIRSAEALLQGDHATAVEASARDNAEMFYARSVATVLLLRAQALAANGQVQDARRLYRQLAQQRITPDGDLETKVLVAHIAAHRLARLP